MTPLEKLYDIADHSGISVFGFIMPLNTSVAIKQGSKYYIGIDRSKVENTSEETVTVAHEIGHCATDSFYSEQDSTRTRARCEKRADEWAINTILPFSDFYSAYEGGCREVWEFAEELGVTCSFAEKAMLYYKNRIKTGQKTDEYKYTASCNGC